MLLCKQKPDFVTGRWLLKLFEPSGRGVLKYKNYDFKAQQQFENVAVLIKRLTFEILKTVVLKHANGQIPTIIPFSS
jgi:hypothetical protein